MWFQKKKTWLGLTKDGLYPALGLVGYTIAVDVLFSNGGSLFPNINPAIGPVMFLLLFCFSVLFCGLVVFYRPYMLFMDKKGKEAAALVVATAKWLGIFLVIAVLCVALLSRG